MRYCYLLLLSMLMACSSPDRSVRIVRVGLSHSQSHSYTQALEKVGQEIHDQSQGRIALQIFHSSRLGSEKEMQEMLTIGTLDMAITGLLNHYNPLFAVFELPYLYRDREHVSQVFTGETFAELGETLHPYGIRVAGYYENGFRHLTNSQKRILAPSDLKGMMIRVPENPAYVATMESVGALPVTLSFSELYTALLQGVVDGQENPLQNIWYGRLYEAQSHVSMTGHIYNAAYLLAGTRFWESLSKADQQMFQVAIDRSIRWQLAEMKQLDAEFKEKLTQQGMTFSYPDREAFQLAVQPAYETLYQDLGNEAREIVDQIKQTGLTP